MDWGTSNVRVMRLATGGRIIEQRSDPRGAGELTPGAFAAVLHDVARDWLTQAPVLVCGMAGSRSGWREVAYQPCPASLIDLAGALVRPDPDREIFIVPGVAAMGAAGLVDVMRGEETQIMGLRNDEGDGWAVAPGTHSKWIRLEGGRIAAFRTFVTGELFAALGASTLLAGRRAEGEGDDGAFRIGVERGLTERALTAALFSIRVDLLAGRLSPEAAPDCLSGLLIGSEIAAQPYAMRGERLVLVGASDLMRRYALALGIAGFGPVESCDAADVTARGLWRIWEARHDQP